LWCFAEFGCGTEMTLPNGAKLGSYEVVAAIGAGGMGEVYRARDTKLGRIVAIKVLPASFVGDGERMARFEREAKLLASLNHPNIAAIYGFEDSNGAHALVMELVEGPTLAERIEKGPIPLEEALPIAKQICEALEYAHERGIVHRDLKPANIKIGSNDAVKILDFGLAKALEGDPASVDISSSPTISRMATQAGIILGTAAYMSPEQAKGKSVDRRADIWAFGCVLCEMLTGKMAFSGETVTDTLAAIIKSEPDWSQLPSETPARVRVLLKRCWQKDPRQRLRDIGDARVSLEEVLAGSSESYATAGVTFPVARRIVPWLLAGLLTGALITGLLMWRFAGVSGPDTDMHFSAVTNFAGVQAQPALSPDGHSVAFVSDRDGNYNIYVGLTGGGSLVQVTNGANLEARPAWSPDGSTLAYARLNRSGLWDIWEVPSLGGTPRRVILNASDPAWSPDGRSLAYESLSDRGLWISSSSGENRRRLASPTAGWRDSEPRFSPDAREVAFSERADGPYAELQVVDLNSGTVRQLTHDGALALSPAWSPDGKFIYFASSRGGTMNVWKVSASGGKPEQVTSGQGDDAQLDVSADGKKIVFSTWRQNANIARLDLNAKPGRPDAKLLTTDPARSQDAPVYSPNGKYIAYFSNLKGAENESIWVANADGSNPVQLVRDDRVDVFPQWELDSEHLIYAVAFTPPEFDRVAISGGTPEIVVKNVRDLFFDVGPDGRLLFRSSNGDVEAFDPRDQKTQTLGRTPASFGKAAVRWSPDGRSVIYIVAEKREDDPNAGLWVDDFKSAPRQIFRGWVDSWFARGPDNEIYFLEGKPDLDAVLCKLDSDGKGFRQTPVTIRMIRNYWVDPAQNPADRFAVSPDGRYVAFDKQTILSANIGMITNVR
jgi:eukaryotic-like serine/threonine-protein kinase